MPIGIIASILAIIGLVTVIKFAIGTVNDFTDKKAEKAEYEKMLTPVVMFDPDPFDDLTEADVSQLLNGAIWSLLMNENKTYSEGLTSGIDVPQEDIEEAFVDLFGTEIDIASLHSSIDMSEYEITYDAARKVYVLPITGFESAYTPKVYEIEKQGSSVILSVGYIGNKAWVQIDGDNIVAPEPDKYMKITMRERDGDQYVSSIQAADGQEVIGTTNPPRDPEPEIETTVPVTETTEASTQAVTDENGDVVTTEPETDENGEPVTTAEPETDENGEPVETESEEETTEEE